MYCTNCGQEVLPAANFCTECGTKVLRPEERGPRLEQPQASRPVSESSKASSESSDDPAPAASLPIASLPSPRAGQSSKSRPWIRFLARSLDMYFGSFGLSLLLAGVTVPPEAASGWPVFLLWVWILVVEPLLMLSIGTTPGKWLLRVRVIPSGGSSISLSAAFVRSFRVWWRGCGACFPLVILFTFASARSRLLRDGVTTWDRDGGFLVTHGPIGPLRMVVAVVLVFIWVFLLLLTASL
jgi:uncharacterized RDD family membrane protein YckC